MLGVSVLLPTVVVLRLGLVLLVGEKRGDVDGEDIGIVRAEVMVMSRKSRSAVKNRARR